MWKIRILALLVLIIGVGIGYFVYKSEPKLSNGNTLPAPAWFAKFPFRMGLDLSGGVHLVYRADVSKVKSENVGDAMSSLRDVIERRVNIFGVSEPVVQVESGGFTNAGENRLIIDLPGVTDVDKAVAMIGQTPLLEFRTENPNKDQPQDLTVDKDGKATANIAEQFITTELTGQYLDHAALEFNQNTGEPTISLVFNSEGAKLFAKITGENVNKIVAIYLDGAPISTPVVREAITDGKAVISGNFNPKEAKTLVGRLNSGALPVPIERISTQTIGATLGEKAVSAGAFAGVIGFLVIALFLILWYRLPGILAVVALGIYISIMLTLFKLLPVTITAAGIAGFIISIGIAVDANVLVFERVKEEIRSGRNISDAVRAGFARAWFSIRDSNTSSFITALILFWFGTSLIKGFALVLGMGVIVSMFSAITISRLFMYSLNISKSNRLTRFLFSSGFSK